MKCFTTKIIVIFILCLDGWCYGEGDMDIAPMEKAEQEALYSVIQGFVGSWWNGSDLYPDPCGWTPIQGVSCDLFDGLWYVTALNVGPVHENSLGCAKEVEFRPPLFEQFKHLKALSFFHCFVSWKKHQVTIPSRNWETLSSSLESLEFRSNPGLVGQIPANFGSLVKLQSLVLLENGLEGQLPANIGNLAGLQRLVLAENRFSGHIPRSFGGLSKLLIFDLSRNLLSGPLPPTLGSLTSLLKLDLSNNLLEGRLPSEIGGLKLLTLLDLRNNKFSGGLTESFEELFSLQQMVLANNPIGGDLMSLEWKKLKQLEMLDLSNTGLTGEIPESVSELNRLRFLDLSDNNLSGHLSPMLAALPCVGALYLNGNNLTGELKFSELFYGKMGRRFGAWDNPNLCYSIGLSPPISHVPFGVKPCHQRVKLLQPNSNAHLADANANLDQNSYVMMASVGSPAIVVNGFWWFIFLDILVMFSL
ncbi:piriformospora indica-insensitive protein 2-like [Humulus lupulus]|uniref:piriformospora indica-insensitive protein 2-like n=1 Tax=Humulus lupulus TaxID=3486 RepID=UPI002B40181D|nr:piriformospora indica-insensitive protein 2-like [Humulus lupulus]